MRLYLKNNNKINNKIRQAQGVPQRQYLTSMHRQALGVIPSTKKKAHYNSRDRYILFNKEAGQTIVPEHSYLGIAMIST